MRKRLIQGTLGIVALGTLYGAHLLYRELLKLDLRGELKQELRPEIEHEYRQTLKIEIDADERAINEALAIASLQDRDQRFSVNEARAFLHELGISTEGHLFQEGGIGHVIDRITPGQPPIHFYWNNQCLGKIHRNALLEYRANHVHPHK